MTWQQLCESNPLATFQEKLRLIDALRMKENPPAKMMRICNDGKLVSR